MSERVVHFTPKEVRRAFRNLDDFIRLCREELTVFGNDLAWAEWSWPRAYFIKLGASPRGCSDSDRLDDAFADFAKAYFRYQQGMKPTAAKNELMAIRLMEAALLQRRGRAEVTLLNGDVFDAAAELARTHYSPVVAYHAGRELERMAKFLSEKRLIEASVGGWKNSVRKPREVSIQTGEEARIRREKKLPSQEALDALAEIFANDPTDPRDVFTSATFVMTLCAPTRVSEVLELPADCEVEEEDSQGELRYGWRFYSAKGFEGDIKWIPSVMVPIAKKAVWRIRKLTEYARSLACWMEICPDKFFRHPECPDVADDMPLTSEQVAAALGLASLSNTGLSRVFGTHTLDGLWRWVRERQPAGFPWVSQEKRIKYSNALFCMTRNALHGQRGTSPLILWMPKIEVFNNNLSPREPLGESHQSIFDRFGYKAADGKRLKLTSHQARHFLNTIANRGGLAQDAIAKWSGRADARQNRVYNHMSEFEMVAAAEAVEPTLALYGPDGSVSQHSPISVKDLELVERGPLHATEFGVCIHDYVVSPCERFRDCLNCEEQVCIKGNKEKESRIRLRLSQGESDLAAAKEAVGFGYAGADRWFEHHEKSVLRLRQLVSLLDNAEVPDGAQIKLSDGGDFSHLGRAIKDGSGGILSSASFTGSELSKSGGKRIDHG